ncbi:MAG TPA: O-antigen ligase family protein, partial [Thermomicrobiales bacterium]|nr:O-antigen ligase family protein [Thermomicrobiales bacterium]
VPFIIARPRVRWTWVLAGIQLVGVALTFSRGSLIAIVAGCALALALAGYRRQIVGLAGVVVVIAALLFVFARDRLLDPGGGGHEPTRFALWRSAWHMIRDRPLFGVGPDQFLYAYWRRYVEPVGWPERYTSHPHNMILDVWLRLGVIGLASFATLIVGVVSQAVQIWREKRDDWLVRGSVVALFGGIVHGMFDNSFFLADLATMTWLFVALIAVSARPQQSPVVAGAPA